MLCRNSYAIFGYWLAGCIVFYFIYGLPMSYIKHYKLDYVNAEQMK
jgi:hypothetical protein